MKSAVSKINRNKAARQDGIVKEMPALLDMFGLDEILNIMNET